MRSWEEKINGETEEKKMNRQADFTDGSSSFDDGFDKLYEKIKTMYRDDELETVKRAYETAKEHHKNQLRQSGEPYIIHPLAVAEIVAEIGLDTANRQVHLRHFPCRRIGILTIDRYIIDISGVALDELCRLYKHTTRTAARIVNTTFIRL